MKKVKSLISLCICAMLLIGNTFVVNAAEQEISVVEMTKDELKEYYEIDKLAMQYGMDVNELVDAVYQGIHSERFSPFSEVESDSTRERNVERVERINGNARTVIAYDQDSTMYVATGNPCASGNYPYVGCIAVHKKSNTDRTPIIPFGTRVYYEDDSVNINGGNYESFIVEDTGDSNFNRSTYWTDVYGGANTTANYTMAINYGLRTVTISW